MSLEPTERTVTDTAQFVSPGLDIGGRVAFWLRSHGYTAKRTARIIDASEATGKRLRSGITPTTDQLTRLSKHFGWGFIEFAFQELLGPPTKADLAEDLSEIKRLLAALEARP